MAKTNMSESVHITVRQNTSRGSGKNFKKTDTFNAFFLVCVEKIATLRKPTEGHCARRRNELYATKHEKCMIAFVPFTQ